MIIPGRRGHLESLEDLSAGGFDDPIYILALFRVGQLRFCFLEQIKRLGRPLMFGFVWVDD